MAKTKLEIWEQYIQNKKEAVQKNAAEEKSGTHGLPGGQSGGKDLPTGKQSYKAPKTEIRPTNTSAWDGGRVTPLSQMPADVASAFRGEKIDLSGAQQLQPEKSTVSKVLSDPMYYAEKVMSKPLDVVQSGVKDLLGGTKKQEERLAANKQMQAAEQPSIGKAV